MRKQKSAPGGGTLRTRHGITEDNGLVRIAERVPGWTRISEPRRLPCTSNNTQGEWLKNIEIGWTPSIDRYKTDRIQFTYWEKDARDKLGTPEGHGWVVSASWQMGKRWLPFARIGDSDGGAGVPAETAVSAGFEYATAHNRAWSLGAGWAKPSDKTHGAGLRDEYLIEASYRVQLSRNLSLMPDVQLLIDPANAPGEDQVWVLGLRAVVTL